MDDGRMDGSIGWRGGSIMRGHSVAVKWGFFLAGWPVGGWYWNCRDGMGMVGGCFVGVGMFIVDIAGLGVVFCDAVKGLRVSEY